VPSSQSNFAEESEDYQEENPAHQRNKELQQAGERLAQFSILEGKDAGKAEGDRCIKASADQHSSDEEVDLTAIMKSLQITIPEDIEIGYQGEEFQRPEENSPFRLLIKVASSSGTPRNIPLKALNNAMSSAWGEKYWIIDQVKPALYIAYFRDEDAMDFVLKRQPWSVESDNLLLEWINPDEANKSFEDYLFKYIYVPIRVYGVPEKFRTSNLMRFVIENSAQPSDLHPPPEITMTVRKDYIQAYAKMDIQKPVKDKVKFYKSPNDFIYFYLNYDKIKRICVFCGMMFHSVQNCPSRSKLIRHLQSIKANTSMVPFSNIGIWTSQATKIPQVALQQESNGGRLPLEFRRDMNLVRAENADCLIPPRLTNSEKQADQSKNIWKTSDNISSSSYQLRHCIALEQPTRNGNTLDSNKSTKDNQPSQKGLKRQAETGILWTEGEEKEHSRTRFKLNHPVSQNLLLVEHLPLLDSSNIGVARLPQTNLRLDSGTKDSLHHSEHSQDKQPQGPYSFNKGISQTVQYERKKNRPIKKYRRMQRRTNFSMGLDTEGNLSWIQSYPNAANHLNLTRDDSNQILVQDEEDLIKNSAASNMLESEISTQYEEQAAAPAFKAPREQ
jgi:hypothetical protein